MELPSDIKDRLNKLFPLAADRQEVEGRLLTYKRWMIKYEGEKAKLRE